MGNAFHVSAYAHLSFYSINALKLDYPSISDSLIVNPSSLAPIFDGFRPRRYDDTMPLQPVKEPFLERPRDVALYNSPRYVHSGRQSMPSRSIDTTKQTRGPSPRFYHVRREGGVVFSGFRELVTLGKMRWYIVVRLL